MKGDCAPDRPEEQEKPKPHNLGIVTLRDGRRIVCKEPTYEELLNAAKRPVTPFTITALCAGLSEEDLRNLPATDGLKIAAMVTSVGREINSLINGDESAPSNVKTS